MLALKKTALNLHQQPYTRELDKLTISNQPVECHYHDGEPDQNIRFERMQVAKVAYFLQRDLDMLMTVQTPPHHS